MGGRPRSEPEVRRPWPSSHRLQVCSTVTHADLLQSVIRQCYLPVRNSRERDTGFPNTKRAFAFIVALPAPLRDVGKADCPCPQPPCLGGWWCSSLSFSLEKTRSRDRCPRSPETERAGGAGGADTFPSKKPSSCAPLPHPPSTHQSRPLPLPPSLAKHRLHKLSISRLLPVSSRSR